MKFNVGDKVKLSPTSRWVDRGSHLPDSGNPLNVVGEVIGITGNEYSVKWNNGTENVSYTDECFYPAEEVDDVQKLYAQRVRELGNELPCGAVLDQIARVALDGRSIDVGDLRCEEVPWKISADEVDDLCIYLQYLKGKMK